jgi:hypothetical protein
MTDPQNPEDDDLVPLAQAGVSSTDVERQLARLCDSGMLGRADCVKDLLRHLVRESLANNVRRLNVADVTEAVYKGPYYPDDTRARVDAGKVRKGLKAFYASGDARPRDIRFDLPQRQWVIYAPRAAGARLVASIWEPTDGAEVYRRLTVRGYIDGLDLDLVHPRIAWVS